MTEWLSILPNLSIGVVAVLGLVYTGIKYSQNQRCAHDKFIAHLDGAAVRHEQAMNKREEALRNVEKEIRVELVSALRDSTIVIRENSKVMERVMNHLDRA